MTRPASLLLIAISVIAGCNPITPNSPDQEPDASPPESDNEPAAKLDSPFEGWDPEQLMREKMGPEAEVTRVARWSGFERGNCPWAQVTVFRANGIKSEETYRVLREELLTRAKKAGWQARVLKEYPRGPGSPALKVRVEYTHGKQRGIIEVEVFPEEGNEIRVQSDGREFGF